MTKEGGIPRILRIGLSNFYYPSLIQPLWMTEGITVYAESNLSPFSGRMNEGHFSAVVATLAKSGKLPSPTKASHVDYDNPLANYYVWGGSFYTYLAQTYGEEGFSRYTDISTRSLTAYLNGFFPCFNLDRAARKVYGKRFPSLWQDWKNNETGRAQDFQLPENPLTADGWLKSDLQLADGKLYFSAYKAQKTGVFSLFPESGIYCLDTQSKEVRTVLTQAGGCL